MWPFVAEGVPLRQGQERGQQEHEGAGERVLLLYSIIRLLCYCIYAYVCTLMMNTTTTYMQLGGKGANLAEMASIGLSVPPGFTVSTEACQQYQEAGRALPPGLWAEVLDGLRWVEEYMGAALGDPRRPLLLSVRSGAAVSMPGMMDTVLNLGLNDQVAAGLAAKSGDRFAYDSFRRFLDMFGNVVSTN
jgi:phosphoenolpyruvate synthase/pyruvate phosphate dikinase